MSQLEISSEVRPWPEPITPTKDGYPCPDGVMRQRVTQALNYFTDGSENLLDWAENQGKLVALEVVKRHGDWFRDLPIDQFLEKVGPEIKEIKGAQRAKDKAADIGTAAHKMIQWRIRGELGLAAGPAPKLSDAAEVAYMAWDDWWKAEGLEPVRCEQVLWDESDDTAGQLDLIAKGPDGFEILDWKVTNWIVPKHHIQVAKYLKLGRLWRDIRRARIVRIPKSLDRIELEVKDLGDMWNFKKRETEKRSYDQLIVSFDLARAMQRIWG